MVLIDTFRCLPDYEKCMLFFRDDSRRCSWMAGLISRFRTEFDDDVEWIVLYALYLYSKQRHSGRLAALACICIACKQLDDESWEIGSGDYERQIPHCTATDLACMELDILKRLDYRTVVHYEKLEDVLLQRMVLAGVAHTI